MFLLRPNSYADAEGWDDLVQAFAESLKHSSLDEMILLLHTATPGPYEQPLEHVRPVSYNLLDDVPQLLLSIPPGALRTGPTRSHQQRPHVEEATGAPPGDNSDGQGEQKRISIPQEGAADGKEAEAIISDRDYEEEIYETRVNAAKTMQDAYRCHLEQKRAGAAKKIQAVYLCHLKRRSVGRTGINTTLAHYWDLLRKRSMEMEWSKDSRYYLLFRVPLGYILVCLDAIKVFAEFKKETKKRMMTEDHKGLEESMEAISQHRCVDIDCILYQALINPPANSSSKRSHFRRNSPRCQNSISSGLSAASNMWFWR